MLAFGADLRLRPSGWAWPGKMLRRFPPAAECRTNRSAGSGLALITAFYPEGDPLLIRIWRHQGRGVDDPL